MSLVSVLEGPTHAFDYPEGFNIVDQLVVRKIGAYDNDLNVAQTLTIGSTANVDIEAGEKVRLFTEATGSVDFYTTAWDGTNRVDTKVVTMSAPDASTSLITTSTQRLEVRGGDHQSTTKVSKSLMLTNEIGSNQFIELPMGEQFYFGNDVNVDHSLQVSGNAVVMSSLLVGDHLITYGNIYGSNLNLWRAIDSNLPENNLISQIGYGFRVNSNHQLELVKYSTFADKTVAKKVALFGQAKFNESMNSDDGLVYDTLNDILGQTDLPEMPNAARTVDLTQPINMYWAEAPSGIHYSGGFIGINNNMPEYHVDVGGSARFQSLTTDLAVIKQASTTSDVRLKNELQAKKPSECLDAINALRVTSYRFKADGEDGKVFDGLMAQEVEEIFPNAVSEQKFGGLEDCKMIDYNQLIANLIGAVQHLSDLVADKA